MNAVIDKIPALVEEELETANVIHSFFHSQHEGYGVLLEEVEEAHAEMIEVEFKLGQIWSCVKRDYTRMAVEYAQDLERKAIRLAAEAIQVAAMAKKFRSASADTTERRLPKGNDQMER